jgi:hypothetical protein
MRTYDSGYLQIILLLVFVVIAVLFLLTQQNTLKAVKPENRLMQPGLVWLQLIPLFGQIWQFWVVIRIAGSIRKEIEFQEGDSILGSSDPRVVERLSKLPTQAVGIVYCISSTIGLGMNWFLTVTPDSSLSLIIPVIFLGGIVCWIIYWVRLAKSRKILVRGAA